jgi:ferredoxin
MSTSEAVHMPLELAYLCADEHCQTVGSCSTHCPACASEAVLNLAAVLNRESEEKDDA